MRSRRLRRDRLFDYHENRRFEHGEAGPKGRRGQKDGIGAPLTGYIRGSPLKKPRVNNNARLFFKGRIRIFAVTLNLPPSQNDYTFNGNLFFFHEYPIYFEAAILI
jgi:hypothetical protein